jgi:hypothetical protein
LEDRITGSAGEQGETMVHGRSSPPPRRSRKDLIVGVGWHAHINWSPPAGAPLLGVPMTDSSGQIIDNDLTDGEEVEILSWRQRSRAAVTYQVRRLRDGSEWWIAAPYLRRECSGIGPVVGDPS